MNKKINTVLAVAVIIIIAGILGTFIWLNKNGRDESIQIQSQPATEKESQQQNNSSEIQTPQETNGKQMNESLCIQQGGLWGQHEDLYDDGRFDMFFACTCPQIKSDETTIIPEGSPLNCK